MLQNRVNCRTSHLMMDDLKLISRGIYRVVCEELGTEDIVDMRRRVMALNPQTRAV